MGRSPPHFILWVFLLRGRARQPPARHGVRLGQHPRRHFMMLARSAGLDELATAGAIMSGIYVGDRCSPVSSSAALVCALTNTNIYANMRRMWTTSALPFALTCAGYLALSLSGPARLAAPDAAGQLDRFFILSGWTLSPAACIVVLQPVPRRRETGHVLEHPRGGRRLPDRTGHGARGTVRLPRLRLHPRARSGNTRRRRHPVHASGGGHRPAVVVLFGHFRRDRPPERFRRPHTTSGGAHRHVPGHDAGKRPRVRHKLQPDARHHPDRAVVPPLLRPQAGHGTSPSKTAPSS